MPSTYALTKTYHDVQRLIQHTARKHVQKHGGEWDDVHADSCLLFMKAYNSYDESKGAFTTHLVWTIHWGLLDRVRSKENLLWRKQEHQEESWEPADTDPGKFRIMEFIDSLSRDARIVVRLLLSECYRDLRLMGYSSTQKEYPEQVRMSIRVILKGVGWTAGRITRAFIEIRESL